MKIHFIGIGGIGVSALAQYYLAKGHEISGSDLTASEVTEFLKAKGIKIFIGQSAGNVSKDADMVIYSPAVQKDNPEYVKAKELGVALHSYPEALGQLTKEYTTIAISGAHGKSTTTAMTALILVKAGIDPTVIIGTKLKEFNNSNFRMGKSQFLVIEACEYDGSFLNYQPNIIAVTNIDKEHMDYFKTFSNVLKTFRNFFSALPSKGFLVVNADDQNLAKISKGEFSTLSYSLKQKEAKQLKKILRIPGKHNISNALAALTVARILNVKDAVSFKSLSEYKGSWRRFELKESKRNGNAITVISDYGHHPNEVLATLTAAREKYPKKTIWLIFQPHQYQRTYYLFNDFVKLFKKIPIDHVLITDIYDVAGRETKAINAKVDSGLLVKKIAKKHVEYMLMQDAELFVKNRIKKGEVLIIMGAGSVYKLFDRF